MEEEEEVEVYSCLTVEKLDLRHGFYQLQPWQMLKVANNSFLGGVTIGCTPISDSEIVLFGTYLSVYDVKNDTLMAMGAEKLEF